MATKNNASQEALKEVIRLALFAAVSAFITAVIKSLTEVQDQTMIITVLTFVFKYADKWIHEKDNGFFKNWKGISPV